MHYVGMVAKFSFIFAELGLACHSVGSGRIGNLNYYYRGGR